MLPAAALRCSRAGVLGHWLPVKRIKLPGDDNRPAAHAHGQELGHGGREELLGGAALHRAGDYSGDAAPVELALVRVVCRAVWGNHMLQVFSERHHYIVAVELHFLHTQQGRYNSR